jgi:transcriptional regulator
VLVHSWDAAVSDDEWRGFLRSGHDFGQLIAPGRDRDLPVVVPTHFLLADDTTVLLHLARPNPVWAAIDERPRALLTVIGDYVFAPSGWGAPEGVAPELGVPTSYYAAIQLSCDVDVVDDDEGKRDILRAQLAHFQPEGGHAAVDGSVPELERLLPGIRGLRLSITSVAAKFKYAGNKTPEHRRRIAERLTERSGSLDAAARDHLLRRTDS